MIVASSAALKILRRGCSPRADVLLLGACSTPFYWHVWVAWSSSWDSHSEILWVIIVVQISMGVLRVLRIVRKWILRIMRVPRVLRLIIHFIKIISHVFVVGIFRIRNLLLFSVSFLSIEVCWTSDRLIVVNLSALAIVLMAVVSTTSAIMPVKGI
jgi:hypothetical protein